MKGKSHNILVFRIGSLGDTLVSLPSFHLIRHKYPNSYITLLTNSPVDGGIKAASSYQILEGSGLIDDFLEYIHNRPTIYSIFRLACLIRSKNIDLVIYLMPPRTPQQKVRDFIFFILCGISHIKGILASTKYGYFLGDNRILYESEAQRLLRSIGFGGEGLRQSLFSINLSKNEREVASRVLGKLGISCPFIALSVGTKVLAKDWGIDNWIEFIENLKKIASNYGLVFVGSADEYERCQSLLLRWPNMTLNLCGQHNPRESAAILEKSTLFIGHDSGPMHLASSVGIRAVSIFSARTKPGIWYPFGNEDNVFYNNVPCSNCGLDKCIEQKMVCIRSISPLNVANHVHKLLLNH